MNRTRLLLFAVALAGCGGPNPVSPVKTVAMVLGTGGKYEPQAVELTTLTDFTALEGKAATLTGAARIEVDATDPQLQDIGSLDAETLQQLLVKNPGRAPRAALISQAGRFWPADFHSWNLVTTYFNFERAFLYFRDVGRLPEAELTGSRVYYFPHFTLRTGPDHFPNPDRDNALFFSPVQAFMVLPFENLQELPLGMNQGVIAHEFSHRVFNKRVYGGQPVPAPLLAWGSASATSVIKSMDEGFADYHAYVASCSSSFGCNTRTFEPSLPAAEVDRRDLSRPQVACMSKQLRRDLLRLPSSDFLSLGREYEVGVVLAGGLYSAGEQLGDRNLVSQSLLASYADPTSGRSGFKELADLSLKAPEQFTLPRVAASILSHLPDVDSRRTVCAAILDQWQLRLGDIGAICPFDTVSAGLCCDINVPCVANSDCASNVCEDDITWNGSTTATCQCPPPQR